VRTLLLSAIVSGLFVFQSSVVVAQQTNTAGANAARYGIGVVDVSYIFKNYDKFKTAMEGIKSEVEAAEGKLKADRESVQSKEQMRGQYKPGSPEFKQLDEEIARLKAEFNLTAGRVRNEFLERESTVYYQTYLEVSQAVTYFAQQHNIGVVLRFNGDRVDPNLRQDVLRAINKPLVYQNNIDITPDVLALLSRGEAGAIAPTANAAPPKRR